MSGTELINYIREHDLDSREIMVRTEDGQLHYVSLENAPELTEDYEAIIETIPE
jgi:hypothetical protein